MLQLSVELESLMQIELEWLFSTKIEKSSKKADNILYLCDKGLIRQNARTDENFLFYCNNNNIVIFYQLKQSPEYLKLVWQVSNFHFKKIKLTKQKTKHHLIFEIYEVFKEQEKLVAVFDSINEAVNEEIIRISREKTLYVLIDICENLENEKHVTYIRKYHKKHENMSHFDLFKKICQLN